MTILTLRRTALAGATALSLLALPLQAHAFDLRTLPLIGALIEMFRPAQKAPVQQQPTVAYPVNSGGVTVWSVPQPSAGYTYVNGQAQRVYNTYTPLGQLQSYNVPIDYQNLQRTNPQAAAQIQAQLGIVQPSQTAQWQYNVSPVAYQQTVPTAPTLSGLNMSTGAASSTGAAGTYGYSVPSASPAGTSVPTSLSDTRVVDTNTSGTYKWPVATNSTGTTGYVSSVYGPRDRDNFIAGCSDGTAPASHCGVQMHNGVDLKVAYGTPVESMTSGKVVYVDPYCKNPAAKLEFNKDPTSVTPRGGCAVSVLNANGEMVTYQHLSDPGNLKAGDTINAGDPIGKSGNSGGSFGAHLDLSICNISEEKVAAAQKAKSNITRCEAIGGKTINPLDKLDPNDPRTATARAKEKMNTDYLACKKKAGKDFAALDKCRSAFKAAYNKPPAATAKPATKPYEPLTGKLNMGRG